MHVSSIATQLPGQCDFYIFTSITEGRSWQLVGDHIRPRVAVPKKWHWPVGRAFGMKPVTKGGSTRWIPGLGRSFPILDQKIGRWYWSLNPNAGAGLFTTKACTKALSSRRTSNSVTISHREVRESGILRIGRRGDRVRCGLPTAASDFPGNRFECRSQWEINFGLGGLTARPSIILPR